MEKSKFWDLRCQNRKYHKSLRTLFCSAFTFTSLGVFRFRLTSKLYILAAVKHLPFFHPKWRNMMSLKRHFLRKSIEGFLWNFNGRRQINADESKECFASISAAVFVLLRKSGRGTESVPHGTVGRIGLLARYGAKKNRFSKRTILCHHWGRKISIPHNWCIDVPKTPLVSAAWLQT